MSTITEVHGVAIVKLGRPVKEFACYLDDEIDCGWQLHPSFPSAAAWAKKAVGRVNARNAERHGAEWATEDEFAITSFMLYNTDDKIAARYELKGGKWVCVEKSKELYER
ncbi:MAG TPA: hypothetical protein VFN26_21490 [Candidatus Acidoferrum sp.]|nr:hypothetical protein [Candidatus Acidoferrum sp.]